MSFLHFLGDSSRPGDVNRPAHRALADETPPGAVFALDSAVRAGRHPAETVNQPAARLAYSTAARGGHSAVRDRAGPAFHRRSGARGDWRFAIADGASRGARRQPEHGGDLRWHSNPGARRPIAARNLAYQSGTVWNLILAAAGPQAIFDRPSANYSTLLGEVTRARPLPQRMHVQGALSAAGEMLSAAGGDKVRHELVVVSDFQRTNWATADFSVLPRDTVIQLESIAPLETPANLAIVRVGPQQRVERGRPFRLEVEVGNYSPMPRQVTVEVTVGESAFRLHGTCTAGGRSTLVAETVLSVEGWQVGAARFVDVEDALSADNTRPLALQVYPQPHYLLLTKQSAESRPSSSYFLERAISPELPGDGRAGEKITRVDPSRVSRDALTSADLLLLDHPGKLSDQSLQLIASLLHRGRGVLYVVAEPADATNLKLLTRAAGSGLQIPVVHSPPVGLALHTCFWPYIKPPGNRRLRCLATKASAVLGPVQLQRRIGHPPRAARLCCCSTTCWQPTTTSQPVSS